MWRFGFKRHCSRRPNESRSPKGVALNQLINVAVAEIVSALRTESYFLTRGGRANIEKAKKILKRAGRNKFAGPRR
jgi:hypothetical protein